MGWLSPSFCMVYMWVKVHQNPVTHAVFFRWEWRKAYSFKTAVICKYMTARSLYYKEWSKEWSLLYSKWEPHAYCYFAGWLYFQNLIHTCIYIYMKITLILLWFFKCIFTFYLMCVLGGAEQYFVHLFYYVLSLLDQNYSSCLMMWL